LSKKKEPITDDLIVAKKMQEELDERLARE
jgi:hypothetical protein